MHVFSRVGIIGTVSVGLFSTADAAWARQPAQPLHALRAPAGDREFHPRDAAGRYLAIHFLPTTDTPQCTEFVREFLRRGPELAGLRQVFVHPDEAASARSWAEQFGEDADAVYVDPGAALAMDLRVPNAVPALGAPPRIPVTIVMSPDGVELFRRVGNGPDDFERFDDFAHRLEDASAPPAIAQYNLPARTSPAVAGYDVVAYFTQHKAVKGRPALLSTFRGVRYQFDSDANRRLFAQDPDRYVPTYGGWCASAMGAKGAKVEIDPTNFKVKDGRLFLFYKSLFGDALADWNQHEQEWEPAADRNWKKLTGEDPAIPDR